jgi:tRNA threonylcarbamoyladenosine biosynthesis protein TsaE
MAKNAAGRSLKKAMSVSTMHLNLPDSRVTEMMGVALARAFPGPGAGGVVYLQGELGTGKTTCARSLLHALGVIGPVRSPTYTLVDTYRLADLTCVHADLYRLQSAAEVEELGLRDLTGPGYLLLIEWPEKGGAAVPPFDLTLSLRYVDEDRAALVNATGRVGNAWLAKLGRDNSLAPYVSNLT